MSYAVDNLPPVHPGEILADEIAALRISARAFARHIGVPHNAVTGIMHGDRAVTALMAIRLARAFATTPEYWMNLQGIYDLKVAHADLPAAVAEIQPFAVA
jgi:addiction module HigA family antidote